MSEAALTKILNDCSKLEAEIQVFKASEPVEGACDAIVNHISQGSEPLCVKPPPGQVNPWVAKGAGGGCIIS